ncbi:MAG: C4-type zinc ribbon domain-containing protein [Verrucomicrobia bacterium]|nr:C4-type zinc ribbon domain-containing protein [Verrucomicrobiota bacterium]
MLEVIEKLLILQDRDRKIVRVQTELASIGPERAALEGRNHSAQVALEAAKRNTNQIESARKELELEVDAKKLLIEKYSIQQFQTKKNDEYRALGHEIDGCKEAISKLEDRQLELMEQADEAHAKALSAGKSAKEAAKLVDSQKVALGEREETLKKQLAEFESNYQELAAAVEETVLTRYQRIRKQKGETSVVGVERCVCGGCHMKLPAQVVLSCQQQQEIVCCPNCGRILYYARHMDLAVVD